jgi:RNA polymerase sigma factor (sigma-70 family)
MMRQATAKRSRGPSDEATAMKDEIGDHVRALRRYGLVLTRNAEEAEDLVQEALTKALAGSHLFSPGRDLRVWLFSILHNVHVSRLRRRRVALRAEAQIDRTGVRAPSQIVHMELREALDCLDRLPEDQRRAVALIALESLSYAQAAAVLGVPLGTLMSRLARGREALRRMTEGEAPAANQASRLPTRARR